MSVLVLVVLFGVVALLSIFLLSLLQIASDADDEMDETPMRGGLELAEELEQVKRREIPPPDELES